MISIIITNARFSEEEMASVNFVFVLKMIIVMIQFHIIENK